jgi:hypothetical protein
LFLEEGKEVMCIEKKMALVREGEPEGTHRDFHLYIAISKKGGGVKRLVLSLAVMGTAIALAAGMALAQATTQKFTDTLPIDEVLTNPCTGESVHFTGEFLFVSHVTQDENGGLHVYSSIQPRGLSGTGLESGTRYRFVGTDESVVYIPEGGVREFTSVRHFRVVSENSSDNLLVSATFHFTVDANGEPTAEVDKFALRCVG